MLLKKICFDLHIVPGSTAEIKQKQDKKYAKKDENKTETQKKYDTLLSPVHVRDSAEREIKGER